MHLYVYFSTHAQLCCASAKPSSAKPWAFRQEVKLRQIIPVRIRNCQVQKLIFDQSLRFLYNIYIDWKEWHMTTRDFFADFYELHYSEFVEAELSEMFCDTTTQDENFDLDVPF